jgi:hypothetical protein
VFLKVIGVALLVMGAFPAILSTAVGLSRLGEAGAGGSAAQNISTGIGGVLVAAYGISILIRHRLACGRWWFLAAWAMNLLTPIGLFFLLVTASTTIAIRQRYMRFFGAL